MRGAQGLRAAKSAGNMRQYRYEKFRDHTRKCPLKTDRLEPVAAHTRDDHRHRGLQRCRDGAHQ